MYKSQWYCVSNGNISQTARKILHFNTDEKFQAPFTARGEHTGLNKGEKKSGENIYIYIITLIA